jgi:hypothetical protein
MNDQPAPASAGRAAACAVAWLAVSAAIGGALVLSGSQIGGPRDWSSGSITAWIDADPVGAVFVAVIAIAMSLIAYLVISACAVLLAAVARIGRLPRLALVAHALATPLVRRTLATLLGLGLAVATTDGSQPARAATTASVGPTDESPPAPPDEPSVASMRLVAPAPSDPVAPVVAGTETTASATATWTIASGDHLWGLSERALSEAWGRAPTDAEVASYLTSVVDLNREVFVVPDEHDLVFPGQVFAVPTLPGG